MDTSCELPAKANKPLFNKRLRKMQAFNFKKRKFMNGDHWGCEVSVPFCFLNPVVLVCNGLEIVAKVQDERV